MEGIGFRQMLKIKELDKYDFLTLRFCSTHRFPFPRGILDGLKARGFRTNLGYKDAGVLLLAWANAGGYYLGESFPSHLPCLHHAECPIL